MNESPITQLHGEHSEIMKAGKLGYKLQRYGAIFKELKNLISHASRNLFIQ
jgi:hypothetical protein